MSLITKDLHAIYNEGYECPLDHAEDVVMGFLNGSIKVPYLQKLIKPVLLELYKDGYYGAPELKVDAISSAIDQIEKRAKNLKDLILNPEKIKQRIPDKIWRCLNERYCFLSGGSALKAITGEEWETEWDLYVLSGKYNDFLVKNNIKLLHTIEMHTPFQGYKCEGFNVYIVDDSSVTSLFDLTICQHYISISDKQIIIQASDQTWEDTHQKILRLNPKASPRLDRIKKYVERGFTKDKSVDVILNRPSPRTAKKAFPVMEPAVFQEPAIFNGDVPEIMEEDLGALET